MVMTVVNFFNVFSSSRTLLFMSISMNRIARLVLQSFTITLHNRRVVMIGRIVC